LNSLPAEYQRFGEVVLDAWDLLQDFSMDSGVRANTARTRQNQRCDRIWAAYLARHVGRLIVFADAPLHSRTDL
jgi:hypothetical protein